MVGGPSWSVGAFYGSWKAVCQSYHQSDCSDLTDGYQNEADSRPGLYRDSTYYGCVQQNAFQNEDSG